MALFPFSIRSLGLLTRSLQATKESNAIRNEKKSIPKNIVNVSLPICVDVNAIEDYVTDLPGSQGKKGNRMYHILILIKEEEANQFFRGSKAF